MQKYFLVGLLLVAVLISGCATKPIGNVEVLEKDIVVLCNLMAQYCQDDYAHFKEKVVTLENENELIIYAQTDCCTEFDVHSVNKSSEKINIELREKGEEVCLCGAHLKKIDLKLNTTLSLENLNIWQIQEYANKKIQIYPKP